MISELDSEEARLICSMDANKHALGLEAMEFAKL
jgi:hypothetical protein